MEQAINYFNQVNDLAAQGVPIDWKAVASQMVVILRQPVAPPPVAPPVDTDIP